MYSNVLILICCSMLSLQTVLSECPYKPTPTQTYTYARELTGDGEYFLFWNWNATSIVFEVHVKTHGYIALGLSKTGKMFPADIVTGWVKKDGTAVFTDRYSHGYFMPKKDKSQDYKLLKAEENEFGTVFKFSRLLETCDSEDSAITDDTVRVIYAYHPEEPESEDGLMYHGGDRRGFVSLSLLGTQKKPPKLPNDLKHYDFLNGINGDYKVPAKDTTYHCTTHQMPDIGGKHHVIKYEPVLTPGMEKIVHHIVLYRCRGVEPKYAGMDYECYVLRKEYKPECRSVYLMYEIGAGAFYWPENAGLSVGAEGDPSFFVMETHYANPNMKEGLLDNSGIRIIYTKHLREHEAGVMETGMEISLSQFIPPKDPSFLSEGVCSESCLKLGLPNPGDEIKVFALFHHSHLLATGMKTRLIRNGVELPPIADDQNYDFNFQAARVMKKEISIKHGDSLIIECNYNSTGREHVTLGGLSIFDEMCISFLMYYPKVKLDACLSSPAHDAPSDFKMDQMTNYLKHVDHHYDDQMKRLHSMVDDIQWQDPKVREIFHKKSHMSGFDHQCFYKGKRIRNDYFKRPNVTQLYVPPKSKCEN